MNLKMKLLVGAALATMAISGAANASMATTQSGNSSLILTLADVADGISATFDLGYTNNTFSQTTSNSWNLNSANYGTAFSDFFAAANPAKTTFTVMSGGAFGTAAGSQDLFTTVASTWTTVANTTLQNMQRNFDTYITANSVLQNNSGLNADVVSAATGAAAYAGTGLAYGTSGKIANAGAVTTVAIGTNAYVWNIVRSSTSGINNATASQLTVGGANPYFSLSTNGTLSYVAAAPVPEADTWAMLLGGVVLMGFIARRRSSFEVV